MKTPHILIIIGLVLIILGLFFIHTYTSSPGFVPSDVAQEFNENAPQCNGFSFLLNAEAVAADAPGRSLCIGVLK